MAWCNIRRCAWLGSAPASSRVDWDVRPEDWRLPGWRSAISIVLRSTARAAANNVQLFGAFEQWTIAVHPPSPSPQHKGKEHKGNRPQACASSGASCPGPISYRPRARSVQQLAACTAHPACQSTARPLHRPDAHHVDHFKPTSRRASLHLAAEGGGPCGRQGPSWRARHERRCSHTSVATVRRTMQTGRKPVTGSRGMHCSV